ncbi:MAG: grasp-with-spasm system ATP-grasp peptide maturase [Bacteroidales bacterium]|jgi:ATP-GRASP peptide maturase of grasp-with-spasm system|nr:grasp-with-spasm system ATP-grasp peptide maturase [Bacteroidales bacterium]
MILIISESTDITTSIVVNWLNYYSTPFLRINDFYNLKFHYQINNKTKQLYILKQNKKYCINDINVVWFRRFKVNSDIKFGKNTKHSLIEDINRFVIQEKQSILSLLTIELANKYWLNHPSQGRVNKQLQLQVANLVGLNIPATLITNSKKELISFKKKYKSIITKPIQEAATFVINKYSVTTFTREVLDEEIATMPEYFMPIQVQNKINKDFEIRTFFLDGKCFSMAMFTQSDVKTQIDFRNYNFDNPARRVPYKLPLDIENKLAKFMEIMKINCGSFDLIKTKDEKYIFLEVNPVGQFGMTSFPCNYNLEKEVALHLINKNKYYEK